MSWILTETGFDKAKSAFYGNKFFIGNGYMGVRGTVDEAEQDSLPAVNLAGVYDRVGDGWREPINAFNGFYGYIVIDDKPYILGRDEALSHEMELDYRHGILIRKTVWKTPRGTVRFETRRFVSMAQVCLGAQQYTVSADFHADIKIVSGIDAKVWDINGPHLENIRLEEGDYLSARGVTHEKEIPVAVSVYMDAEFPCIRRVISEEEIIKYEWNFVTEIGQEYNLEKIICVLCGDEVSGREERMQSLINCPPGKCYGKLLEEQRAYWEDVWEKAAITISGDEQAMEALNFSIYQLYSIAPHHKKGLSIPARGLSGQTYKGAVFWDTEMFMMDVFLNTNPDIARNLLSYRIDGLKGAMEKAKVYGYRGAFYAWESQEDGFDACSDYNVVDVFTQRPMKTYFKDKQVHISAAVVYAFFRYMQTTGDLSILDEGGAEVIFHCAVFYWDLLVQRVSRNCYEIHDVIGPDEYHERVNNNGYTNRMAAFVFEQAIDILEKGYLPQYREEWLEAFRDARKKMFIPSPNADGIIPQFDGYLNLEDVSLENVRRRILNPKEYWGGAYGVASGTQIIKQADVVTWLAMFPEDYPEEIRRKNWEYYEPRTEHGSSLSSCMYGLLACESGLVEEAYGMFMKSAKADLVAGGKEWAGLIYIGGIHPASHGGAYMVAVRGFAGVYVDKNGKLQAHPRLPEKWRCMEFNLQYRGEWYHVSVTRDQASLTLLRSTTETGR